MWLFGVASPMLGPITMICRGRIGIAGWSLLCVVLTGCYEWVRVPPAEVGKLDQERARTVPPSAVPRDAYWRAHVDEDDRPAPVEPPGEPRRDPHVLLTEDGSTVDVKATVGVKITTARGSVAFKRPINCVVTPEKLAIGATGQEPISFRREDVTATDVHVYEKWLSRSLWVVGMTVAGVLTGLAVEHAFRGMKPIQMTSGAMSGGP
jgi:hypothetical protein